LELDPLAVIKISGMSRTPHCPDEMILAGKSPREACAVLSEKTGCYDPAILERIKACFADMALANDADDKRFPVAISLTYVRNLRVGSVLAGDVHAKDRRLLISAGHRITEVFLAKIQNYNETETPVRPARSAYAGGQVMRILIAELA
jgi:hypothetical protein